MQPLNLVALILTFCAVFASATSQVALAQENVAQDRVTLGWGRMLTNDALGDGHDRWRTGSYTISHIRGRDWAGRLPDQPAALLEYRLRAETIAPEDLTGVNPKDRRYAGAVSLGLYTHFERAGFETTSGVEIVAVGPQTGLGQLQKQVHSWLDLPEPTVLDRQIGNDVYIAVDTEIAHTWALSDTLHLRPFAEARVGDEDFLRLGGDLMVGSFAASALMVRESVTGQRYRAVVGDRGAGLSFVMGGDVARIFDSVYLPQGGIDAEASRERLRSGLYWQGARSDFFSGVTWLSPEFEGQAEGQILGSISLHLKF